MQTWGLHPWNGIHETKEAPYVTSATKFLGSGPFTEVYSTVNTVTGKFKCHMYEMMEMQTFLGSEQLRQGKHIP